MKTLLIDLMNPFDNKKIINKRIDPFAKQVYLNLDALDVASRYTVIKNELLDIQTPFHAANSQIMVDDGLTVGQTEYRINIVSEYQEFMSENIGPVKKKYKLNHPVFIEFYPHLLIDIYKMNKTTDLLIMERSAAAMLAHHADWDASDPDFVDAMEAFPTRYSNASDAQVTGKQSRNTSRGNRNEFRPQLNDTLFAAYNLAKYWTRGDYAGMKAIFGGMENLIPNGRHTIDTYGGNIAKIATANATSENWDATYWALCRNVGNTKLAFGVQNLATTPVGSNGFILNKGKAKSVQVITMGAPGAQFLNTTNLDLNLEGAWEVEIYFK